jgi:type II secretory pathway pseudopilin PulG
LIELLIVISIMGVLAAFTIPVLISIKQGQYRKTATAELKQIELAVERFHDAYGAYPPGNGNNALPNQLFYELTGTTNINNGSPRVFQSLDGRQTHPGSYLTSVFGPGVSAFVNCSKFNSSAEDSTYAKDFLLSLKPNRIGTYTNTLNGLTVDVLVTSVGGPDQNYIQQVGFSGNPFRYLNPGTQNPNSYDLWVDLVIGGKTNRISNWSKTYQIIP